MNNTLSDRELAIEYGRHVLGVLPDNTVTGIIAHKGQFWKSYIDTGSWSKYPQWERDYDYTPLSSALVQFVGGEEMEINECVYEGTHYKSAPMESAGLSGWRYEYERKRRFRKEVLWGNITLPAPAVFNQYGNCYIEVGHTEEVDDLYWDFVEENYEHRHSHYAATSSGEKA